MWKGRGKPDQGKTHFPEVLISDYHIRISAFFSDKKGGEVNIMSASEKRMAERSPLSSRFSPVDCSLIVGREKIELEVVNYHYRGACFRTSVNDYRIQEKRHISSSELD